MTVDVRMVYLCLERHLGRFERILARELNVQEEHTSEKRQAGPIIVAATRTDPHQQVLHSIWGGSFPRSTSSFDNRFKAISCFKNLSCVDVCGVNESFKKRGRGFLL